MILRYPGGKAKIAAKIVGIIKDRLNKSGEINEYREPFFGGGAVGLQVIRDCPEIGRFWFNDADPTMACLWQSVVQRSDSMRVILGCLDPSVDYFHFYRSFLRGIERPDDLGHFDRASIACMKISCHQMSYSGLGTMAGGPIGGAKQESKYDVGCRYDAQRISGKIAHVRDLLNSVELHPEVCTCLDFEEVVRAPGDAIIYLDPPYYKAGPGLYQIAFDHAAHERLAHMLRSEERPWLLSYDRHPVIEGLYGGWATIEEVPISYSINGAVKTSEWMISNFDPGGEPPHTIDGSMSSDRPAP
jgi:DNA adenine methylase